MTGERAGLRVAIVYHFFAHYRRAVLIELVRRGRHRYRFVGDRRDPVSPDIAPWEIPASVPFEFAPLRRLGGNVLWQRGLLRLALRRDLDVVIFLGNPYWLTTWLAAALARIAGKRVLFWTHGWTTRESGMKAWARRTFYRIAHGLLLYGHFGKDRAIECGFAPDRLYVIYNSLDVDEQRAARSRVDRDQLRALRAKLFTRPEIPVAVCTGRLHAFRRVDLLLRATARLKQAGHPVNVLLVGDGPDRPRLESLARELDLDVCFYGACYDESVLCALLMASNVLVSPGMIGLAAMHAMGYGTPAISHDDPYGQTPEFEAILPGRTGDFFRRDDEEDLARAIRTWTRTEFPSEETRLACDEVIDRFWNPRFQRVAIERAIDGRPADDLSWQHERLAGAPDGEDA